MDANVNQDYTHLIQDTNPQVGIIQQVQKIKDAMMIINGKAYAVDLSAIGKEGNDGRVTVALAEAKREPEMDSLGQRIMNTVNMVMQNAVDGRTALDNQQAQSNDLLSSVIDRTRYAVNQMIHGTKDNEIAKILQYNAGTTKLLDTEHMYIPESFNKEQSLRVMNDISKRLGIEALKTMDMDMMRMAGTLAMHAGTMEGNQYSASDVQSVFNTLAEREPSLNREGTMKEFNNYLENFTNESQIHQEMAPMMKAFSERMSKDLDHSVRREAYTTFRDIEEARAYAGERTGSSHHGVTPQGKNEFRVYGDGYNTKPWVIESSKGSIADQLALDQVLSSYKVRIRGYGYNHDRDSDLLAVNMGNGQYDRVDPLGKKTTEIPKFKFERNTGNLAMNDKANEFRTLENNGLEK